ncbi:MAG: hypothetical protein LBP95_12155 [Deltaproteobacteria bacterium]|jgi:hypothetical protein|nr:hypothetical protein [Deltaproteobacteria bacterium]
MTSLAAAKKQAFPREGNKDLPTEYENILTKTYGSKCKVCHPEIAPGGRSASSSADMTILLS